MKRGIKREGLKGRLTCIVFVVLAALLEAVPGSVYFRQTDWDVTEISYSSCYSYISDNPFPKITALLTAVALIVGLLYALFDGKRFGCAAGILCASAATVWMFSAAFYDDYRFSLISWAIQLCLIAAVYSYAKSLDVVNWFRTLKSVKNGEMKMNIEVFDGGLLDSNTYLVWDTESGEGMTVDCGTRPSVIKAFAEANGIKIRYIVLTHGHYDHADYVEDFKRAFPDAVTVCHANEIKVLTDPEANVSALLGFERVYPEPDKTVAEGDVLKLGELAFKVLHTPGHTPGSICLLCESEKTLFTGDTLFVRGYGRTDFRYGSVQDLIGSLKRLTSLDGETVFYSGHGRSGLLKNEHIY